MTATKDEVQQSLERYRNLFETSPDAVFITDRHLDILLANPAACSLFGLDTQDERAGNFGQLLVDPALCSKLINSFRRRRYAGTSTAVFLNAEGDEIHCLVAIRILRNKHGIKEYQCIVRDITQHMHTLETLRDVESRYRLLAENVTDGIWTTDLTNNITHMSPSIKPIIGYTAEETMSKTLSDLVVPSSLGPAMEVLHRQMEMEHSKKKDMSRTWVIEIEMYHKQGGTIWAEVKTTFLRDSKGKAIGLIGVTHDITQRKRSENALRALSSRLVEVQEAERRHVARELHDQIGQSLTGLKLSLELLSDLPADQIPAKVQDTQGLINDLMNRVRDLSLELRPSMLDDLGLLPTLLRHLERYETQTRINVGFRQRGLERRFATEVETAAYRIVQESLTNVARHAGVDSVEVELVTERNRLNIRIEDNGTGFDPNLRLKNGNSSGLAGMQERVTLLGGQLRIESAPGQGTRIVATLPLLKQVSRRKRGGAQ